MAKKLSIIFTVACVIFCVGMFLVTLRENIIKQKILMVEAFCEASYYEGQRDAITGDVRIAFKNGEYEWIKSPWDDKVKENGYAKHPAEALQYR